MHRERIARLGQFTVDQGECILAVLGQFRGIVAVAADRRDQRGRRRVDHDAERR